MRLKTLNGAPLRADLDFSADALLPSDEATKFFYEDAPRIGNVEDAAFKWRHVTSKDQRLRSEWSQPYLPTGGFHESDTEVSFAVPGVGASLDANEDDTTILDTTATFEETSFGEEEFVHHSLIFHDSLLSSQIASVGASNHMTTSQSFLSTSMDSTSGIDMNSFQNSNSDGPILQVPTTLKLTTLGALPSAAHLRRIYPQTPTPNILCVLTAAPEDREVFVKKGGYRMRLREITVADDTKSGFKVSFWQKPSNGSESQNALSYALQRVKAGDILLLRNIALNAFRDDVYGQSLNLSITRVRTSIEILMSGGGISSRQLGALPAPVVTALMRVKKWANTHVASDTASRKKRKDESEISSRFTKRFLRSSDMHDEMLPPDTMEPA
ncbi:hypothetical protein BU23DRAFT_550654 [Bimuria novae-zelandiae CBS 107.79]|uniref:Nucleic acid-binding protein n=1 Tax=Bimuria novae-zelandiae CBS 107.79 TaxID=1447943 RepID=A0A6A5VJC3_9PLEO|nr:hypothetical protein BU23DRAFT_550654 [Bimuria novae-zelandiae CBS 107.79]